MMTVRLRRCAVIDFTIILHVLIMVIEQEDTLAKWTKIARMDCIAEVINALQSLQES